MMPRYLTNAAFALLVLTSVSGEVLAQSLPSLSPEEANALKQGRLVMHPKTFRAGGAQMFGGTSWQKVDLPPEVVWEAVLDTSRYPNMLPQVSEARLLGNSPGSRLVFVRHGQGVVSARYHLVMQCRTLTRTAIFHVDQTRPGNLNRGRGYMAIQPFGEGESLMTFHIMADVGGGMVTSLLRPQIQEWMLRVPQTIKRYVEGPGRERYHQLAQR